MATWLQFELPATLIGEQRESKSTYVTTYQTEVLLPKDSKYADYHFWHPSKLVGGSSTIAKITYNDSFTFTLIRRDREPGKKYKRYKLSISELLAIYEPETAKVKAKLEKKEQKRLAQIGSIEAVECRSELWGNRTWFLFHHGKRYYYGSGAFFCDEKNVVQQKVIVEAVPRRVFESAYDDLLKLWEDYRMIQDIRYAVEKCNCRATDKVIAIGNSFDELCQNWEREFIDSAAMIIINNKG